MRRDLSGKHYLIISQTTLKNRFLEVYQKSIRDSTGVSMFLMKKHFPKFFGVF